MRSRHRFVAIAAFGAIALAACGGDDPGDPGAGATTTIDAGAGSGSSTTAPGDDPTTSTGSTVAGPATSSGGDGGFDDLDDLAAAAAAALLTPGEIGPGFVDAGYEPGVQADVTPCGTPGADTVVAPSITVGVQATQSSPAATVTEEIRIYVDAQEADTAYTAGVAGLSCPGTDDDSSSAVSFTGLGDLTDELGGRETLGWTFTSEGAQGLVVASRLDAVVVFLQFVIPTGTDPAALPDPLDVAGAAVAKVAAR